MDKYIHGKQQTFYLIEETDFGSFKMPANSRKQTPTKNSLSAREMWLQAVKGRSSYAGANRKGGMSTKKTPNEYWVGTLRRSQGLLYILNFCIYSPIKQQIMHFTCFLFKLIYVLMPFVRKSFILKVYRMKLLQWTLLVKMVHLVRLFLFLALVIIYGRKRVLKNQALPGGQLMVLKVCNAPVSFPILSNMYIY